MSEIEIQQMQRAIDEAIRRGHEKLRERQGGRAMLGHKQATSKGEGEHAVGGGGTSVELHVSAFR